MRESKDLLSFIDTEGYHQFCCWRSSRPKIITKVGSYLITLEESEFTPLFSSWENSISTAFQSDKSKIQMSALMGFSVFYHFQDDQDQIKHSINPVLSLIWNKNQNVSKAAIQCLIWLVNENQECSSFFQEPVNYAFNCLSSKKMKSNWYSALYLIRKAQKHVPDHLSNLIFQHFQTIFAILEEKDLGIPFIQDETSHIIQSFLLRYPKNNTPPFFYQSFQKCKSIIESQSHSSNPNNNVRGPLSILRSFYTVHRKYFSPNFHSFIESLLDLSNNSPDELLYEALSFISIIPSSELDDNQIKKLFNILIHRSSTLMTSSGIFSDKKPTQIQISHINLFEKIICLFSPFPQSIEKDIFQNIFDFCIKLLHGNYSNFGFQILNILLEKHYQIPPLWNIFTTSNVCDSYLQCLKFLTPFPSEVKNYLNKIVQKDFSPKSSQILQIRALSIIKYFHSQLFSLSDSQTFFQQDPEKTKSNYHKFLDLCESISEFLSSEVKISMMETFHEILSECALDLPRFNEFVLNLSLYDPDKKVRKAALKAIQPTEQISLNPKIIHPLYDSSIKARRECIKLLSAVYHYNPLEIANHIQIFAQELFTEINQRNSPHDMSKHISILPLLVLYFPTPLEPFISEIIHLCTKLIQDQYIFYNQRITPFDEQAKSQNVKSSKLAYIFRKVNEPYFLRADADLLQTLARLGDKVMPFFTEVIGAFETIINGQNNEQLLVSAIESLRTLANSAEKGINYRVRAPHLISILMKLLLNTKSERICVATLQLLGASCDSVSSFINGELDPSYQEPSINYRDPFYYIDTVVKILKPIIAPDWKYSSHDSHLSMQLFEVFTNIFNAEPYATRYFTLILPMFLQEINLVADKQKQQLFTYLEVLIRKSPFESVKSLSEIIQYIHKYIHFPNSVILLASIAANSERSNPGIFNSIYTDVISILQTIYTAPNAKLVVYNAFGTRVGSTLFTIGESKDSDKSIIQSELQYVKALLQFITFSILYQGQNMDSYIFAIENLNFQNHDVTVFSYICYSLLFLLRKGDFNHYKGRIIIMLISQLKQFFKIITEQKLNDQQIFIPIIGLIQNLDVPPHFIASLQKLISTSAFLQKSFDFQNHSVFQMNEKLFIDKIQFLNNDQIFVPSNAPAPIPDPIPLEFENLQMPEEDAIESWLDSLSHTTCEHSPSPILRCCLPLLSIFPDFKISIFNTVFLSCWREATDEGRKHFSEIIQQIFRTCLQKHKHIDQRLVSLAEFLDRALEPLLIPDIDIVNVCESRPYKLALLQRIVYSGNEDSYDFGNQQHQQTSAPANVLNSLIELDLALGRSTSANGLMGKVPPTSTFSELLGDWKTALKLHQDKGETSAEIRCYSHMEEWQRIRELESEFNNMDGKIQEETARFFALAFYHSEDFNKVEEFVKHFPDEKNLSEYFFSSLYNLKMGRLDSAHSDLQGGFQFLARNVKIFTGDDAPQVIRYMMYAHLFVELDETLDLLRKNSTETDLNDDKSETSDSQFWGKRVRGFKRDSEGWIKLIEVRQLTFSKGPEFTNAKLKMISALKKDKRWNLIDTYFDRFFRDEFTPEIGLMQAKISWERGRHSEAIYALQYILNPPETKHRRLPSDSLANIFPFNGHALSPPSIPIVCSNSSSGSSESSRENSTTPPRFSSKVINQQSFPRRHGGFFPEPPPSVSSLHKMSKFNNTVATRSFTDSGNGFITQEDRNFVQNMISKKFVSFEMNERLQSKIMRTLASYLLHDANSAHANEFSRSHTHNRKTSFGSDFRQSFHQGNLPRNQEIGQNPLRQAIELYEICTSKTPGDYRAWQGLAYSAAKLSWQTNGGQYAIISIRAFLKALKQHPENSLEYLCQLFSILFGIHDSSFINDEIIRDLLNLPASAINKALPQLIAQISHSDPKISELVRRILTSFGQTQFETLYFQLRVYCDSEDARKASAAHSLIAELSASQPVITELQLFRDGMIRSSMSWFELWHAKLKAALIANSHGDTEKMRTILASLLKSYDRPECDLDRWFVQAYAAPIAKIAQLFSTLRDSSPSKLRALIEVMASLQDLLATRLKKLKTIILARVSEPLANCRNFAMGIPGAPPEHDGKKPVLLKIQPTLQVLSTQQHPRCVTMLSTSGKLVKFLLKANEDLRLDQRIMQFFELTNSLIGHAGLETEILIAVYPIVPLALTSGLIGWVDGADTLHQMICDDREIRRRPQALEFEEIEYEAFCALAIPQKLEYFKTICKRCKADEIRELFWTRAPSAAAWMRRQRRFTFSTALMSMVGYVIGLGDRHPSNIMVQRDTGRVIHIDFGDSFEINLTRESYPENVPFRLTRMIINALDQGQTEGMFRAACIEYLAFLREHKDLLIAQLEIFVHEPLEDDKAREPTKIIKRVNAKLEGKDDFFDGASGDPETQADALIRIAADPTVYISHYGGWCPFW